MRLLLTRNVTTDHFLLLFAGSCLGVAQSPWPPGTQVQASSVLPPLLNLHAYFNESFAIDGSPTTYWNDATNHAFPDFLTITFPHALTLSGISLLSNPDGWVTGYQVQVLLPDNSWEQVADVEGAPTVFSLANFSQPVDCLAMQITVNNATISPNHDVYSRIDEVTPKYVDAAGPSSNTGDHGPSPSSNASSVPDSSATSSSAPNPTSDSNPRHGISAAQSRLAAIIGGGIGAAVLLFLVVVVAIYRAKRRKRRRSPQFWVRKGQADTSPVSETSNDTPEMQKVELDGKRLPGAELDIASVSSPREMSHGE